MIAIYIRCHARCPYLAGGSQQGPVPFPAQTLQLVAVLLQNCRHTHTPSLRGARRGKDLRHHIHVIHKKKKT